MMMPDRDWSSESGYRFGFNGKEQDSEVDGEGSFYDYGLRIYNPQLGKFLSVDPLLVSYPWYSPYHFAGCSPIQFIDLDGLEEARYPASATVIENTYIFNDEDGSRVIGGEAFKSGTKKVQRGSRTGDVLVVNRYISGGVMTVTPPMNQGSNLVEPIEVTPLSSIQISCKDCPAPSPTPEPVLIPKPVIAAKLPSEQRPTRPGKALEIGKIENESANWYSDTGELGPEMIEYLTELVERANNSENIKSIGISVYQNTGEQPLPQFYKPTQKALVNIKTKLRELGLKSTIDIKGDIVNDVHLTYDTDSDIGKRGTVFVIE
jgi:RHS repeat-associated protein